MVKWVFSILQNTWKYSVYADNRKLDIKFIINDNCISCGKCEKLCPLSNIKLIEGQPIWGNHCTHCMACISRCPKGAIEYGKKTKDRIRYVCPK